MILPLLLAAVLCSCVTRRENSLSRFEFERAQMGLPFRITLYAPDEKTAKAAADAAYARIKQLNDMMSDYEPDSELSRLSASAGSGQAVPVSEDLWKVLSAAQKFSEQSRGAFDVTVGPMVQLWRKARRERKFPDAKKLAAARAAVGYEKMRLHPKNRTVELLSKNMKLDLGGIAKGYAVEEAQKVLQKNGIRSALVAGGGDMRATQPPPGKPGWKIELLEMGPEVGPGQAAVFANPFVWLKNMALATSGDTFQFVELDGRRYSHIVDPRTGVGLTDHGLVNILTPDGMTADALSKIASVLPPLEALSLIEKSPLVAARIWRKPGEKVERFETKNFGKWVEGD